ncbi:hypothetical protein PHLCEN_2v6673 [Hermanssonia centrifuga]|uniref:Uncharacterized protein n=1 Tax=Hermanssonia centrifuga TaxID=98765 RepID=A0A2R6NZK2_9APHY|nr:hypothetical protein PHLCEN_2v6673 [Hermanssonia centrifuga]
MAESNCFRRALFRFWSFCNIMRHGLEQSLESPTWRAGVAFLHCFPSPELHAIERIGGFLKQVLKWVYCAADHETRDQYLRRLHLVPPYNLVMLGPDAILQAYMRMEPIMHFDGSFNRSVASISFQRVWTKRSVDPQTRIDNLNKAILERVLGTSDRCHRCHNIQGIQLWGRGNWFLWSSEVSPSMFCTLLPGRLQDNRLETRSLKKYLMARDDCGRLTFDFNKFFEEIFELAERSRSVNFGHPWENHVWNKDEWYCTSCLMDLMREVLFKWWIRRKIKAKGMHATDKQKYSGTCLTLRDTTTCANRSYPSTTNVFD